MPAPVVPVWKKAPFIRLTTSLSAGILLQWYAQPAATPAWIILAGSLLVILSFFFIPLFDRYRMSVLCGLAICLVFACLGALLARQGDIRRHPNWMGHNIPRAAAAWIVTLDEPLSEKTRSYKANGRVEQLWVNGRTIDVKGKIIVYFKKDPVAGREALADQAGYGTRIIFTKPLQEIKNSGNPGGFDYRRYTLFQGITHQVFLENGQYRFLPGNHGNRFRHFIYNSRERIIGILREHIRGPKENGLAAALLIGYKDDLDKTLVQSYSNTGVVHVIAISGLHLGLIYWLLLLLLRPMSHYKKWRWLRPGLVIAGLWLFSLLAGAQPSVLRSALMFSCLVAGNSFKRKTPVLNSLALSAFVLLCINPYWIWDLGFQLSYAAVLSIVLFMRPVYNWLYLENKALDHGWKLNAVTISAQVLTTPLSIFHFHQFPNFFLLTNFIAVPLSSLILFGEIILCVISPAPVLAGILGNWLSALIRLMNHYVEYIEALPFSVWEGLHINAAQVILLFLLVAAVTSWLSRKNVSALVWGLIFLVCFFAIRSYSFVQASRQQQLIVYNIPRRPAMDMLLGRRYYFLGDSSLLAEEFARNFHLKPARVRYRVSAAVPGTGPPLTGNYLGAGKKRIFILDEKMVYKETSSRPVIDLLLVNGNPRVTMKELARSLDIRQVVIGVTTGSRKRYSWLKDCDSLHIPCHDVVNRGAFVMNLR